MISVKSKGNFNNTERFLNKARRMDVKDILKKYGEIGLKALFDATPKDTGLTAQSWTYEIETKDGVSTISWSNTNIQNGIQIAVILDTGHGTGTGGYVRGRNYIEPAIQPIFEQLASDAWKEVTDA